MTRSVETEPPAQIVPDDDSCAPAPDESQSAREFMIRTAPELERRQVPRAFSQSDTVLSALFCDSPREGNGLTTRELSMIEDVEYQGSDSQQCLCSDVVERGQRVKFLPCCHVFHSDCIDPWLRTHATCPIDKQKVLDVPLV